MFVRSLASASIESWKSENVHEYARSSVFFCVAMSSSVNEESHWTGGSGAEVNEHSSDQYYCHDEANRAEGQKNFIEE